MRGARVTKSRSTGSLAGKLVAASPLDAVGGAAARGSGRTPKRHGGPSDLAAYRAVADAIFDQRLPPGTKLTEDTLGEIFGVSRTIVRNALLRLAHEKIVEIRPNKGAVVASPSADEARHVFEARRIVEAAIVERAARRISEAQIARLRRLTEEEREAFDRGDRRAWVRLSGAFHLELADIAGNGALADFLRDLVSRTSLVVALYETPGKSACGPHEHVELLDAIAAGNLTLAAGLMTRHLQACEDRLNLDGDRSAVDLRAVFRDTAGTAARPTAIRAARAARQLRAIDDQAGAARRAPIRAKGKRSRASSGA
jgi:DNA-binding GntR family transcriptional regulator